MSASFFTFFINESKVELNLSNPLYSTTDNIDPSKENVYALGLFLPYSYIFVNFSLTILMDMILTKWKESTPTADMRMSVSTKREDKQP